MTAEELLRPRFYVIEEYPNSIFKKGDILQRIKGSTNDWYHTDEKAWTANLCLEDLEKYPNLFKPLKWWENRKVEDMPKKLICKAIPEDNEIMEIKEWDMNILYGWIDPISRSGCGLLNFNYEYGYFPID